MKKLVYLFLLLSSVSFSQITSVAGYEFDNQYIYKINNTGSTDYFYDTLRFESVFDFEEREHFVTYQDGRNRRLFWEDEGVVYTGSYFGRNDEISEKEAYLFLFDSSRELTKWHAVEVVNLDTTLQINNSYYSEVKVYDYYYILDEVRLESRMFVSSAGHLLKYIWFEQGNIIQIRELVDIIDINGQSIVTALENEIVESELLETTYYSTNGVLLENPQQGVPIIKMEKYSTNGEVEYKRSLFILD